MAFVITVLCTAWSMCYVLFGASTEGKQWFQTLASNLADDAKGGVPVITLIVPLLVSSSTCTLLLLAPSGAKNHSGASVFRRIPKTAKRLLRQCLCKRRGDINFNKVSLIFIFAPCAVYLLSFIQSHLQSEKGSLDDNLMHTGNAFGWTAMIALSYFLIPVTRHSPILALLDWNPVCAVRLHIWSGRICIMGVIVHGFFHMFRWWYVSGESIVRMLIPPETCWGRTSNIYEPKCNDPKSSCSCYDHFRNLTGLLALVALITIGISSIGYVRRRYYRLFYLVHVTSGPTMLLMATLHWNRMILFLAPSMLYYVSSSIPVIVESWRKHTRDGGVEIVSVQEIPDNDGFTAEKRPCVAITFAASDQAVGEYRPGQYVKLRSPNLSAISHPFTVNTVPNYPNQMRIIFRVMGPFTSKLRHELLQEESSNILCKPIVQVDAFYGPQNRVEQALRHDIVVIIAGGIGITPYLSLLYSLCSELNHGTNHTTKEVILHWMCRDVNLINFIQNKYFQPMRETQRVERGESCSGKIRIVIHTTAKISGASGSAFVSYSDDIGTTMEEGKISRVQSQELHILSEPISSKNEALTICRQREGVPLSPCRFRCGSKASLINNVPCFLTFSSISWIGFASIWILYTRVQDKHEIASRVWAFLAVVIVSFVISYLVNILMDCTSQDTHYQLALDGRVRRHMGKLFRKLNSDVILTDTDCTEDYDEDINRVQSSSSLVGLSMVQRSINDHGEVDVVPVRFGGSCDDNRSSIVEDNEPKRTLSIEQSEGRPSTRSLINCCDDAAYPGVFMCGPTSMMRELKDVIKLRCNMRVQQCLPADIAIQNTSYSSNSNTWLVHVLRIQLSNMHQYFCKNSCQSYFKTGQQSLQCALSHTICYSLTFIFITQNSSVI